MVLIWKSWKRPTWECFYILCTIHGSSVVIICWPSTCSPHIHGDTSGWLVGHILFMTILWLPHCAFGSLTNSPSNRLSTLPPKRKYSAWQAMLYLVFPPCNQYHLLSGRVISGIECISPFSSSALICQKNPTIATLTSENGSIWSPKAMEWNICPKLTFRGQKGQKPKIPTLWD